MAIEDILDRIVMGRWSKPLPRSLSKKLKLKRARAAVRESDTLGSSSLPVKVFEAAREWAFHVVEDQGVQLSSTKFGGDLEPAAGTGYSMG